MVQVGSEIWKTVEGYERYKVSNFGNIMGVHGRIMKKSTNSEGYAVLNFFENKIVKTVAVHRVVAKAFVSNPENKPFVNHKDGNRLNNHADNLEWCTQSENMRHAVDMGLVRKTKVAQYTLDGRFLCIFSSLNEAARWVNGNASTIKKCCTGQFKHSKGYKWEFFK